jgi:hypothetical protein
MLDACVHSAAFFHDGRHDDFFKFFGEDAIARVLTRMKTQEKLHCTSNNLYKLLINSITMTISISVLPLSPHMKAKKSLKDLLMSCDDSLFSSAGDATETTCDESLTCRSDIQEKRVTFCMTAIIVDTLHVKDYTTEEWRATWYTAQEMNGLKKKRRDVLRRMDQLNKDWDVYDGTDDGDECFRGLEGKTQLIRRRRHVEHKAAAAAVLDEQDEQYSRGLLDHSYIAYLYEMHTRHNMERARQRGERDAKAAAAAVIEAAVSRKSHETTSWSWNIFAASA